jgi:BirA family biotin operon repressor/biotin-[acetyl-CoA-carboxylase] ligase
MTALPQGYSHYQQMSVTSTNDVAKRLVREGQGHGTLVSAKLQTEGRGRHGRKWVSELGNLYASLVVKPARPLNEWPQLSFVIAIALAEALNEYLGDKKTAIKWPNDILVDGKKIAGVLLETEGDVLIIGFGINCVSHPSDVSYPATHLAEQQAQATPVDVNALLFNCAAHFDKCYKLWTMKGFSAIQPVWLSMVTGLNQAITVDQGAGPLQGQFMGITAGEGYLILKKTDGSLVTVSAGDVYL